MTSDPSDPIAAFVDLVARGELDDAARALRGVTSAFRRATGARLTVAAVTTGPLEGSTSAAQLAFSVGMLELLHGTHRARPNGARPDPAAAAEWFAASAQLAEGTDTQLAGQANFHRLLATVQTHPAAAAAEAAVFGDSSTPAAGLRARLFVSLASVGHFSDALTSVVAGDAPGLARGDDPLERAAGLDALYSLGVASRVAGDLRAAAAFIEDCLAHCIGRVDDAHAAFLAAACESELAAVRTDQRRANELAGVPQPVHHVDTFWRDAHGLYLDGWALLGDWEVDAILVESGGRVATASRRSRDDLAAFYPAAPTRLAGFAAYIAGEAADRATLILRSGTAETRTEFALPLESLPLPEPIAAPAAATRALARSIAAAPAGAVLHLGARAASETQLAFAREALGDRDVVGFDIHDGIGVDVVGDVHRLTEYFDRGSFAVIYSASLLEHVTAPWLVAVQCARLLDVGGVTAHVAPWTWPTHSQPNDFWRFSPEGLEQLFGATAGLRVLESGTSGAVAVTPTPDWRADAPLMSTTTSASLTWVVAEKTDASADAVAWPYDARTGAEVARQYPVDGIAPGSAFA